MSSALLLVSCTGGLTIVPEAPDAASDAGVRDATIDRTSGDATTEDVSVPDASVPDVSVPGDDGGDAATIHDAAPPDAAADAPPPDAAPDALAPDAGPRYCDLGVAKGDPAGGTVSLFDAEGNPLPAAHYRITYVDGCMTYGGGQPYTVHAYAPSTTAPAYATWILVNPDGHFVPALLPGFWIYGPDAGASPADYAGCVALNQTAPPLEIDYDAGVPLAVQVYDSPLSDNTGGPDGGAPTWRLERYSEDGSCP